MKSLLLILVLAALSVSNEAAAIQEAEDAVAEMIMESVISSRDDYLPSNEPAAIQESDVTVRANLNTGTIGSRDRVLRRDYFRMLPVSGVVQYADISYSGSSSIRISAIRAIEQGATQFATPSIRAGGIGRNSVTIRLTTARGRGFYYMIEIWGR